MVVVVEAVWQAEQCRMKTPLVLGRNRLAALMWLWFALLVSLLSTLLLLF